MDDQDLDNALRGWANDVGDDNAFIGRLSQIPTQHVQVPRPWLKRALKSMGGWGFAAPQLAGLVAAAWLGFSTGSAALEVDDSLINDTMSAHLFGAVDSFEG